MIKRLFITLTLMCMALCAYAGHNIKIDFRNGSTMFFTLNSKPTVSFQNRCLEVNKDSKITFSFDDIVNYHSSEMAGASSHNSLNILLVNNETLQVKNAHPGSTIAVTSATGSVAFKSKVGSDGKVNIQMPNRAGVYTLSAGYQSFKIIRK